MFVRWIGSNPNRWGEVAWAFEYNDRLGRFFCFYCGATESRATSTHRSSLFWHEKCATLPELIKAMSNQGSERPGYDEVKVFEVARADSELALQVVAQRSALPDEIALRTDSVEDARDVLTKYGARGVPDAKGFSAPFLWYNMLPGRSVPLRKLTVYLFQLRISGEGNLPFSAAEIEDHARHLAENDKEVLSVGECLVCRSGSAYIVGLNLAVDAALSVRAGRSIAERLEQAIRNGSPQIRHVFVRVDAYDPAE